MSSRDSGVAGDPPAAAAVAAEPEEEEGRPPDSRRVRRLPPEGRPDTALLYDSTYAHTAAPDRTPGASTHVVVKSSRASSVGLPVQPRSGMTMASWRAS